MAETFTAEEVQEIATGVLGPTVLNRDDPEMLGDKKTPSLALLLATGVISGQVPTNNKVAALVEAPRKQRLQWWNGADLLSFEGHFGTMKLEFPVGQAHMGDQVVFDVIRHFGIRVNYKSGINGGHSKTNTMTLYNVIKRNEMRFRRGFRHDLGKSLWRTLASNTKAFHSFADLMPANTNDTGTIGGKSRTNHLLRHQLMTGVTTDNCRTKLEKFFRTLNDQALDGDPDLVFCGENFYDLLVEVFLSNDKTVPGKIDYQMAHDKAMQRGEKYQVTLPQDCFMYRDRLFVREPMWQEIDAEDNPTVKLSDQLRVINSKHCGLEQIRDGEGEDDIRHPVPHNQRVQHRSKHGEWACWCDRPGAQGVCVKS